MKIATGPESCADCLCRVCARNVSNDSVNEALDEEGATCCACDFCDINKEVIETEEDCDRYLADTSSDEYESKNSAKHITLINWQHCKNLNDVNTAILENDENWAGLTSADQIISITFDTNHMCYVVTWKYKTEVNDETRTR